MPNIIKIDPYNFELYRFTVDAFFETQCRHNYKYMRIFAGVPRGKGVKRKWCCRWQQFSAISVATSSKTLEII